MVSKKERKTIYWALIFSYLALFPFGQILRTKLSVFGHSIRIHPIDGVALFLLLVWLLTKKSFPKLTQWILAFVMVAAFSLLFSLSIFSINEISIGLLYLARFLAYISVFFITWDIVKGSQKNKSTLLNSLIIVSSASALFGWVQYFFFPDLRALVVYGWDDHYFRLLGTFLDPGFMGIILVLGFLALLSKYLRNLEKTDLILLFFYLLTIAFTYSRASYIALLVGLLIFLQQAKKIGLFLAMITTFVLFILFLPKPGGEGVDLNRMSTVYARVENYSETYEIFKKSPIIGIGYNNFCAARHKYLGTFEEESHSCSGTDSSLLFVLTTTGVVGFVVFLKLIHKFVVNAAKNTYGLVLLSSVGALFVHSIFINSLFYPWVMGWMALLGAISLKNDA